MIGSLLLRECVVPLVALCLNHPAPMVLTVATSRGETEIPVYTHRAHPVISSTDLATVLPLNASVDADGWATVALSQEPFRFLLGTALMVHRGSLVNLVGGAYQLGDTLFVPLQWLSEFVPEVFSERYRYDPLATRFEETGLQPTVVTESPRVTRAVPIETLGSPNPFGLRMAHTVVIDPGHGGPDPGSPGRFLSRGVNEKHVTLGVGLKLGQALEARGINVVMTRSTDVSLTVRRTQAEELNARAARCIEDCTLFVSLHVDAMPRSAGSERANGIHTYIWGGSTTQNARRVAAVENAELEYETDAVDDEIAYIMRDLQVNSYSRESSLLATAVQTAAAAVHPGADRGVDQANFHVLREANRPAILIEMGFATNRSDAEFLESPSGQLRLASAVADGIVRYLREYETRLIGAR